MLNKNTPSVSQYKSVLLAIIPLGFAIACYGVARFAGITSDVSAVLAMFGGVHVVIEGKQYLQRRILPIFAKGNAVVDERTLKRSLLAYIGLISLTPLAGLIACPVTDCFRDVPVEVTVIGAAVLTFGLTQDALRQRGHFARN